MSQKQTEYVRSPTEGRKTADTTPFKAAICVHVYVECSSVRVLVWVCKGFQTDYLCSAKGILVLKALWGSIKLFNRILILAV